MIANKTLNNYNQVILLNKKGIIVESCDSLFDTTDLISKPVQSWLPFLESIFDSLLSMKVGSPEILFSRVEQPYKDLQGFYDFSFIPLSINDGKYILWTIYDNTYIYQQFQRFQQLQNEIAIQRQRLENKAQILLKKNIELIEQSNSDSSNEMLLQANFSHLKNILIEFKKVSSVEHTNALKPFDIHKLLKDISDTYNTRVPNSFSLNFKDDIPTQIKGNQTLLKHIIYHSILFSASNPDFNHQLTVQKLNEQDKNIRLLFTLTMPFLNTDQETLNMVLSTLDNLPLQNSLLHLADRINNIYISKSLIELQDGSFNAIVEKHQSKIQFSLMFQK